MNVGFIIIRNVNSIKHDKLWKESYDSIRRFYKNEQIIIIDNNSNYNYITEHTLINCTVINSEYPESRQMSAYYYHSKFKSFDIAVIIHDSVFVNKFIDFSNIEKAKFLWHFNTHQYDDYKSEKLLLDNLKNNNNIYDLYNTKKWCGALGNMSVINHSFIDILHDKYNFLDLKSVIKNNIHQCALERVIGVLFHLENPDIQQDTSFINEISKLNWGYSYEQYIIDRDNNSLEETFIKTFTARQ